ncbi:hypothetical protein CPLU01_14896, partial [Colletotrichum plurivorum]
QSFEHFASFRKSDAISSSGSQSPFPPVRRFWDRTGRWALFILIGGSLVLLGSLGFLLFLWNGADEAAAGRDSGERWRAIVFAGWTTRAITITAAFMRTAATAQDAVLTAMIAALFLESSGTKLRHLPALSVARAVGPTPISLIGLNLFDRRPSLGLLYWVLLLVTNALWIASQFTSSILLSDFADLSIAGPNTSAVVKTMTSYGEYVTYTNYFGASPPFFPRFAEWNDPEQSQDVHTDEPYVDTGPTLRAAVPWVNLDDRLGLRYYEGASRLWDARVTCFRPEFTNLALVMERRPYTYTVTGDFVCHDRRPVVEPPDHKCSVNCTFNAFKGALICGTNALFSTGTSLPFLESKKKSKMVIKSNLIHSSSPSVWPDDAKPSIRIGGEEGDWILRNEGPWMTAFDSNGLETLSFSSCIMDDLLYNSNVSMSGPPAPSEPVMTWLATPEEEIRGSLDTLEIRHQLGVTHGSSSLEDRGILSLELAASLLTAEDVFNRPVEPYEYSPSIDVGLYSVNEGRPVVFDQVSSIDPDVWTVPHELHTAIFLNILDSTNNPAKALQALSTILNHMQAFDRSTTWTAEQPASYIMSREVSIPAGRDGLLAIVVLVAVQHVVMAIVVALFLSRTRATLLGNSWQSVAQIISPETLEVLLQADDLKDSEVRRSYLDPSEKGLVRRHGSRSQFVKREDSGLGS